MRRIQPILVLALLNICCFIVAETTKPLNVITLKVGQFYRLELPSNPTTGYSWFESKKTPKNAPFTIIKTGYEPEQTGLIGSGGTQFWDIKGIKKGTYTLNLEYKRPWEKKIKPVETKKFSITIN